VILLELTEKEVEVLKQALLKEKLSWEDRSDVSSRFKEAVIETCNSTWAKIDKASQRQEQALIGPKDLFHMVSVAKSEYGHLPADLHLSNKRVEQNDFKHISLASAVIMWLNSKNLLKKAVKFDFTNLSSEFEETEE
jgi:hypothetical protein